MKIQALIKSGLDLLTQSHYDTYAAHQLDELRYFTLDPSYLDVINQYNTQIAGVKP
jgi:hypothetical protein